MERQLILRNVICPVQVSPALFDVAEFEQSLALGTRQDKILLEDLSVVEWEAVRLQVLPERLQLGFKKDADSKVVRMVTEAFLTRLDALAPTAKIGFNAALMLTLAEGDRDPSIELVNADALAGSLGGERGRGGVTLVYSDAISRWWIELSPQPDDEEKWVFDFNRQFERLPGAGLERDEVLDWFSDVETELFAQFETISQGTD